MTRAGGRLASLCPPPPPPPRSRSGCPSASATAPPSAPLGLWQEAELMSSLIEYCIELNTIAEEMNQDVAARPTPTSEPPCHRQHPKLQRQESVLCSRIQRLSTIDYVEDGKQIKRVKPRRTTSFFGHQLSNVPTSYSTVQAAENLEQG